ncbi:disease resistance protein RPV1 [Hevea brasiliensis]|uniref:disease resistance protein RPV1 n=1 Tax=Hevea brasiliensis TaxID=3981 RepID=UPI002600E776|nr:disease resistance protein RPV1 [Hevea brasiliensis]
MIKPESKLIEKIISHISKKLNDHLIPSDSCKDGLVGINSRVKDVQELLCLELVDVRCIGIWGMGGIGKTTIASKLFEQICNQFQGGCFIANVREQLQKYTPDNLQCEILSKVLNNEGLNIGMPSMLSSAIKRRLSRQKFLIILDDVSDLELVEFLIGKHVVFGPGSRIILTSRDKQLLKNVSAEIYEVKKLNDDEALQLFSFHAFKPNFVKKEYMQLSRKAIGYADGNPLALKVLGSKFGKRTEEWEDKLEKLKDIPDRKIQEILRISYDDLDPDEKEIFLDVACFFKWWDKNRAISILEGCGFFAKCGISRLIDKSLISISKRNRLEMHDLVQQMGKDIVGEEKEIGKRSRLYKSKDIYKVLTKDMGTEKVESISANMNEIGFMELSSTAFVKMRNLRLLKFYSFGHDQVKVVLTKRLKSLPQELRYLEWPKYPLKSLPSRMPRSQLKQLWNEDQAAVNLKVIELANSVDLIRIPDLSNSPKLEGLQIALSSMKYEVEKFNSGSSFSLWKIKIKSSLILQGLWKAIDDNFLEGTKEAEKVNIKGKALSAIFMNIIDNVLCEIIGESSASEMNGKVFLGNNLALPMEGIGNIRLRMFDGIVRIMECWHVPGLKRNLISLGIFDIHGFRYHAENGVLKVYKASMGNTVSGKPAVASESNNQNQTQLWVKFHKKQCTRAEEQCHSNLWGPNKITSKSGPGLLNVRSNERFLISANSTVQYLQKRLGLSLSFSDDSFFPLEVLILSGCTNLVEISSSIGRLSQLRELELNSCMSLKSIPSSIGDLKCLYELDFSGCSKLSSLPDAICNLKSLIELKVSKCVNLNGLPENLGNLGSLKRLYADESGITKLPSSMNQLKQLIQLDCSKCRNLVGIPSSIGCLSLLRELELNSCMSLKSIPGSIGELKCLYELDFSGCSKLASLPDAICNLKSLIFFDVSGCVNLNGMPENMGNLESLKRLHANESGITKLPSSLNQLRQIEGLACSRCTNLVEIPDSICDLKSLISINVSGCVNLSGLPENLGNLKSLGMLIADESGITKLPSSINQLGKLTMLKCSGCKGLILPPLTGLTNLRCLFLNNCEMLELPDSLGSLTSLEKITLHGNDFESIPESIKQLSKLLVLDLRDCKRLRGCLVYLLSVADS